MRVHPDLDDLMMPRPDQSPSQSAAALAGVALSRIGELETWLRNDLLKMSVLEGEADLAATRVEAGNGPATDSGRLPRNNV